MVEINGDPIKKTRHPNPLLNLQPVLCLEIFFLLFTTQFQCQFFKFVLISHKFRPAPGLQEFIEFFFGYIKIIKIESTGNQNKEANNEEDDVYIVYGIEKLIVGNVIRKKEGGCSNDDTKQPKTNAKSRHEKHVGLEYFNEFI